MAFRGEQEEYKKREAEFKAEAEAARARYEDMQRVMEEKMRETEKALNNATA